MTPADRTRLVKLLGLLGSDQAGERASAALACSDMVKRHGMTWDDVVKLCAPPPAYSTRPAFDAAYEAQKTAAMKAQVDEQMRQQAWASQWNFNQPYGREK